MTNLLKLGEVLPKYFRHGSTLVVTGLKPIDKINLLLEILDGLVRNNNLLSTAEGGYPVLVQCDFWNEEQRQWYRDIVERSNVDIVLDDTGYFVKDPEMNIYRGHIGYPRFSAVFMGNMEMVSKAEYRDVLSMDEVIHAWYPSALAVIVDRRESGLLSIRELHSPTLVNPTIVSPE